MKKMMRIALSLFLCFLLSTQTLAAVISHDISTGDLNITSDNVNDDGYLVTGTTDQYTITVGEDVTTIITLENVKIAANGESAIDVGDYADVTLNVSGENTVTSDTHAAIHTTRGDLTITSETGGTLDASNMLIDEEGYVWNNTESAAIGSDEGEDMKGDITISGNVTVNANSNNDGAAIGSGQAEYEYDEETQAETYIGGNMTGSITIEENAVVNAYSDSDGAGIGSGMYGDMDGEIVIQDDATVNAFSDDDGAGIGAGDCGSVGWDGTIIIQDNATVTATGDDEGAGIGAGEGGYMMGEITISGGTVTAVSEDDGAGIGSGETEYDYYYDETTGKEYEIPVGGDMTGTINITGGTVTAVSDDQGAGIGAGQGGDMRGEINITGGTIVATSGGEGAAIGAGAIDFAYNYETDQYDIPSGGNMNGSITITDDAAVTAESESSTPIGAAEGGAMNGTISTPDNADTPTEDPTPNRIYEFVYFRNLFTESKNISATFHHVDAPTKLIEAEVDEDTAAKLTEGALENNVLLLVELSFDNESSRSFTLWFRLGHEFAGKQVEIRWLEDGELVTKTLVVDASGKVGMTCTQLGSFAIIEK